MMQEHRQLIKRANARAEKTAGQATDFFLNFTLIWLRQTLMWRINEAHLVYCNGP
jgi:hypothetical protein